MGKDAKYIVRLVSDERLQLQALVDEGRGSKTVRQRARVLLKADQAEGAPGWTDERVAEFAEVSLSTVHRVREQFVEEGLEATLQRRPSSQRQYRKLDGVGEAKLIATACSQAPEGRSRWTLHLLADKLVELKVVESISHECVRSVLKKNELQPHRKQQWVIPPEQNAEFVAAMEDVLEVYQRPHDPQRPVVCLDEQSKQLIRETRAVIPAAPGRVERIDDEYERNGTANLFMLFAPLEGWRHVQVTDRRTKIDFAEVIRQLVDEHFAHAEKIVLVMDNLNTHRPASLYEAFPPAEARRLIEKLEIHYTPKHGSWLDMAETELSILTKQCLDRRIPDSATLVCEVAAWEHQRNTAQSKINWQFTTKQARTKLKRLYPSIET